MTPKEKANELFKKFQPHALGICEDPIETYNAKQCALITIDEILNDDWYITTHEDLMNRKKYWEEVKDIITNF